ncbi:MAG: chromosomal replication initiator protein DnaA [Candidatus Saccharibacteria bacterium]
MENSEAKLWELVRGNLQLSLSSANFSTWIAPTQAESITKTSAHIRVPNYMTKHYLETKFYQDILDAFTNIDHPIEKLSFSIGKISKSALPKPESTSQNVNLPDKKPAPEAAVPPTTTPFQSKYNFSNFIVGSGNRLAFSAAQLVVEKPGTAYNPLFLYGPAGVGKTHLMWAINTEIHKLNPDARIVYVTSEQIISEFVQAIRKGEKFTNKYREVDVLLVDDMQFIAGAEKTQEEFFHTFNTLHQNNRQIVLCSDRPPKEIPTLEARLRSRFEWGMVADIQPPDLETRIAIVMQKAQDKGITLDESVADLIARSAEMNIRELEGALTKVLGYCLAHNTELTFEVAEMALGEQNKQKKRVEVKDILQKTASYYNISYDEITGTRRNKEIVLPRQIAMYFMRTELHLSFPIIASKLGGRDHTTVMHGVKKLEKTIPTDTDLAADINKLKAEIF